MNFGVIWCLSYCHVSSKILTDMPQEAGDTMYHVVNTYTKAAPQFEGLPAESSHRLQPVGGNVLEMLAA
jgi:hypothetical protein